MTRDLTITIGGVVRTLTDGTLAINRVSNGTHTFSAEVGAMTGANRIQLHDPVTVVDNATSEVLFAGTITQAPEDSLGGIGDTPIRTRVSASDYNGLPQRIYLNETIPAGSMKAALMVVIAALVAAGYSVSLAAGQVTGPTLPQLEYPYSPGSRCDAVLADIMRLSAGVTTTGWTYRFDYSGVLEAIESTTIPAAFDVDASNPPEGPEGENDLEVRPTLNDNYATRVIVVGASTMQMNRVETFNLVGQSVISLGAVAANANSFRGYLTENGNPKNIGTGSAQWVWDLAARPQTLTRAAGPFTGTVQITYDGLFSGLSIRDNLATPVFEWVEVVDNVFDQALLDLIADAILHERSQQVREAEYSILEAGLHPGTTQHIGPFAFRNVDDDFIVRSVDIAEPADMPGELVSHVMGQTGPSIQTDWRDLYKKWLGEGGGQNFAVTSGTGTAAAAPPLRSVQFNRAGSFGGSADVLEDEDDTGDVYGLEIAPARLAIILDDDEIPGSPSPGPHVQFAIGNRAAGLDQALTFWQTNGASPGVSDNYIEAPGSINIYSNHEINVVGGHTHIGVNDQFAEFVTLRGITQPHGLMPNVRHITANTSLDSAGVPDYAIFHESASNHTVTLTAAPNARLFTATIYGRRLTFMNGDAGGTLTIDGNGTNINTAGTLVLQPGQAAEIQFWGVVSPIWRVVNGIGNIAVGGGGTTGTGDVVGPSSATANSVAGFDGTTGKLIKELQAIDLINASSYLTIGVPPWTPSDYGEVLTVTAGRAATAGNGLTFIDLEPGTDTLRTIPVGQSFTGLYSYPVVATAASGTHGLLALNLFDVGSFTAGGASVTEAATVYIAGDPGIGTNRHALFVNAGVSYFGGILHTSEAVLMSELAFAALPGSPVAGMVANISDCNTATWGATAAGGGVNRAMVRYNGTNWTVAGI